MTTINNTVVYNVVYGNMISLSYTDYEDEVNTKSKVNHDMQLTAVVDHSNDTTPIAIWSV